MRVVFMGTPDFSVPALEALIKAGHEIACVVTQPDKPKDRGQEMKFTPVKDSAIKNNINNIFQPEKVKDESFVKILTRLRPDVIVVVAFGQLLSKVILELPKYGCINIHASLLPKYRGAAPIQWAVIDGEEKSGVTTMYMEEGLDTGDIIEHEEVMLDSEETGGTLHDKLSKIGGRLILSTLEKLESNTAVRTKQDNTLATYAKKLDKKLGKINFNMEATYIERLVRGLNPWPTAFTTLCGQNLKIWSAQLIEDKSDLEIGQIVDVRKNMIVVKTGVECLGITSLQLQGKKRMSVEDFLRGNKIQVGLKLGDE